DGQALLSLRNPHRSPLIQLVDDQGKIVARGVLADEHVEMAVTGDLVEHASSGRVAVEKLRRALLALRHEAMIVLERKKEKTRVGLRRLAHKVCRQVGIFA